MRIDKKNERDDEDGQKNNNRFGMAAAAAAAAAVAEQFRQQHVAIILAKQFKGTTKFSGFIRAFEVLIGEHDEAGWIGQQVEMMLQKQKRLLIATLQDPENPPLKGIDGRRFVGSQTYIADLLIE